LTVYNIFSERFVVGELTLEVYAFCTVLFYYSTFIQSL